MPKIGKKHPIYEAINSGNLEMVKELLQSKSININDVDWKSESFLHYSLRARRESISRYLLKEGIKVNRRDRDGRTPLHYCILYDQDESYLELAQIIVHMNPSVLNIPDIEGETPIFYCVVRPRTNKIFNFLLESGANVNVLNKSNNTAFMCALISHHYNQALTLLDRTDDVSRPNVAIASAIHYAASRGIIYFLRKLLARGVDVNTPDGRGITPLYHAAFQGHMEAVYFLVEVGAQIFVANENGRLMDNPRFREEYPEIFEYLDEYQDLPI